MQLFLETSSLIGAGADPATNVRRGGGIPVKI